MAQEFDKERRRMAVDLCAQGVRDARVLAAFEAVPRHLFVPEDVRKWAYENRPLPIGFGQTISQPFIVAYMTQALALGGAERVLEVGTGSGYQAAILSHLVREVHTVELIPALAERAARVLSDLELMNVFVHAGDGSQGWPGCAPYEAILVSAAAPRVPVRLFEQLTDHGRMILPVGDREYQALEFWRREADTFSHETLLPVLFVPLRGKAGG
jgi:protein-L-isoaspartate(D-aspartate) O-methyltransferase